MRIVVDLNRLFRLHGEETLEYDYAPDEALHEWRCEDRPLQPARNEAEEEDDASQHREINHRWLQECGTYSNQENSTETLLSFPLCRKRGPTAQVGRRLSAEWPCRRS